ncbi:MAG: hypothetical protein IID28_03680 [Planctomycetes bacterium]|nr:hypothetical protein [Planctomycetota bacterium]
MTSAQLMSPGTGRCAAMVGLCVFLCGFTPPSGCTPRGRLTAPTTLSSPVRHTRLWAVVPFTNESGVSTVNSLRIADAFTQQLEQVRGIQMVAVNRVVNAMRIAEIQAVSTPADALNLMEALDVDALVVGTITAYDPYPPPTLGMAVQVFGRLARSTGDRFDPKALVRAPSDTTASMGALGAPPAIAQASGIFDSRNNTTLGLLRKFAEGRTVPDSPFGTEVYLMDIELYTQFVSYWLIRDLLAFERSGLSPVKVASER